MTNQIRNDPFQPWDQNAHARDLEKTDQFNRLVHEHEVNPGGLRSRLEQLAASDSPDAVAMLREAGFESPHAHRLFHLSDGTVGEVFADQNGTWHARVNIAGKTLDFAGEDRDGVMMSAERHAQKNRGPRELTETEALRVARLAQSGQSAAACDLYVRLRLDGEAQRSDEEILTDPKLASLLNSAAITIWRYTRPDYVLDQEFEDIVARAAEIRPLTVNNVDYLFDRFQESHAARAARRPAQTDIPQNELEPAQADVQAELETLSDSALEKLRTQTLRHRGHLIRQFHERVAGR